MSSHHIIRDEQEPPVLVFQLNNNWQDLSDLLGWSPILLISPHLEEEFVIRQTKIDGYLIIENKYSDFSEKDLIYTDDFMVQSLLNWISTKMPTAVNIFCSNQFMMDLFYQLKGKDLTIPLIFFTEVGKFILMPSSRFKKWYPEKFKLDILNMDIKNTRNLKRDGERYLVQKEGFVHIEVEGDLILINEKTR